MGVVGPALAVLLTHAFLEFCVALDTGELLKAGDAAFANSEYHAAVRHYTGAIEQSGSMALPYTKRAAAYISLRQASQALRDLNKALELDSSYVQGYIYRGKLLRQTCSFAGAERDFGRVLELKPGHKTGTQEMERTQAVKAKFDATEAALQKPGTGLERSKEMLAALYEDVQDCVPAQMLEARMYLEAAEWEQVVAVTGRLLKSDERQLEALVLRGKAYFYLNDHDMAKRHFGEALKYDPDYPAARREFNKVKDYDKKRARADRAAEAGEWKDAEVLYIEALHVDQDHRKGNVALWWGLCRARAHVGRHDDAVEACGSVLVLTDNGHGEAKQQIVRSLLEQEKYDEAVVKAKEYLSQHRNDGAFHQLAQEAERRLKISKRKDYYKVLGVDKSASERDIKKAYRDLAKKYHPDKVAADEREAAEIKFREVAEAYEVLSDEEKRARFDSGQDLEEQGGGGHGHGHPFQHGGMHYEFRFGG